MEQWLPWVVQIISGAAGGLGAGKVLKNQSLGTIGDAVSGLVGGGIGAVILNVAAGLQSSGALTASSIGTDVAGGGIGGAVVMIIVSVIKKALGK
jgi:hypothetical protein